MNTPNPSAYCFQIDDNSFFLRDIARKGYRSIFDCFYLALLRDWHTRFRSRFTLNCYYRTEDGFTLAQFPDRYRNEWADQADGLRLTFHADADEPAYPYRDDIRGDAYARGFDRVKREIVRFAGDTSWAPPSIVHYVDIPRSAWPVLSARGVTCLGGFFAASQKGFDRDPETGITLYDISIICNLVTPDNVNGTLDAWATRRPEARVAALLTHEQYFWDFYPNYLPDHPARVERAIRWAVDRNLKPVFCHECSWT